MAEIDPFTIDEKRKEEAKEAKRIRRKEIDDIRQILKLPAGRRYLWRMLSECGVFRSSFTQNSNQTAFNEGIRNIGLKVLEDINEAESTAFAQMQNEYISAVNSKKEEEPEDA